MPAATEVDSISLSEAAPGLQNCSGRFFFRFGDIRGTITVQLASHPYGVFVFEIKPATHKTRPKLPNSAVDRSRHRHTPGSGNGPESRTKRVKQILTLYASSLPNYLPGICRNRFCSSKNLHASKSVRNSESTGRLHKPTATKSHHATRHDQENNNGEAYVVGYGILTSISRKSDC